MVRVQQLKYALLIYFVGFPPGFGYFLGGVLATMAVGFYDKVGLIERVEALEQTVETQAATIDRQDTEIGILHDVLVKVSGLQVLPVHKVFSIHIV
jgi:hypothetical protein